MKVRLFIALAITISLLLTTTIYLASSHRLKSQAQQNEARQRAISSNNEDSNEEPQIKETKVQNYGLPKIHFDKTLTGRIEGHKDIQLRLGRTDDEIGGFYSEAPVYLEQDYHVYMHGTIDSNGQVTLIEYDHYGKPTGTFKGRFFINESTHGVITQFKGDWSSARDKKSLPFFFSEQQFSLSGQTRLVTKERKVENVTHRYWVYAQYPLLESPGRSTASRFNQTISGLINKTIKSYVANEEDNFKRLSKDEDDFKFSSRPDFLDIEYEITAATDEVISVLFTQNTYAGGAHGSDESMVLNFDLRSGKPIKLTDIFQPRSDYLKVISKYASQDLSESLTKRGYPHTGGDWLNLKNEDLKSWNITPRGLLLTFDSYKVAAYSAGPQQILIRYDKLKNTFDQTTDRLPKLITQQIH